MVEEVDPMEAQARPGAHPEPTVDMVETMAAVVAGKMAAAMVATAPRAQCGLSGA